MKEFLRILLFVTLSYTGILQIKAAARAVPSYCDVQDKSSLLHFNFTRLSVSEKVVQSEKSGDSIRLRLCSPLSQKCNGVDGYRVCLTKNNTEIGIGMQAPDHPDPNSGKLEFVFLGDICNGTVKFAVHVIMKCKNEDNYDSQPVMFPHNTNDCNYYLVWETKAACGPENEINCTAVGSAGEHYDLRSLMLPSENYIIPAGAHPDSVIILNVCHSVVFDHDVRCAQSSGSCLRSIGDDEQYRYRNLGQVHEPPKFNILSKELTLTYNSGEMCMVSDVFHAETIIKFSCDYYATDTLPVFVNEEGECRYILTWKTVAACSVESLKNHSIATAGTCKVTNPLTNIEYNLRELMNRDFRSNTTDGTEYSFQVCSSMSDGPCSSGTGACIVKNKISAGMVNANLIWSEGGPYLNYTNGAECGKNLRHYTLIAFFCGAERSTSEPIIMENENCSLIIHWNTPLVCEKRITCEMKDGYISLASLIRWNENYVVKANNTEFHINICRPLVPKPHLTCLHGSSACRVIPEANGHFGNETSLGYTDKNPFFNDKKNVILQYTGGTMCPEDNESTLSSNLTFVCNYTAAMGAPRYKNYQDCTYVFEWRTSIVCETAEGRWEKHCTIVNPRLSHTINLTLLSQKSVFNVKSQTGKEYKISICVDGSHCKGSTVCKDGVGYGTSSVVIFDYNRNVIKLIFSNGTRCKTGLFSSEIHFSCDKSVGIGEPTLIWEYSCSAVFEWKTSVVCVNHTSNAVSIAKEPKVEETMENIKDTDKGHVGTIIGIVLFIASCIALMIYLWSSHRRARLRYFFNSLTPRRVNSRTQYTKVNATEEARLLLNVGESTQCLSDSNSDDELLDT